MILASVSPLGLGLSLCAAAAYAWPAVRAPHLDEHQTRAWVALAWLLHAAVLALGLWGEPAHFGFASALSVTAWLVAALYAIEMRLYPQLPTRWNLCALGAGAVVMGSLFPGPALPDSASAWLALHLAFGVACYGLFGIAVVHAWFMGRAEARMRHAQDPGSGVPLLTLERLTYRFVTAGFVLLSATLLAGILFGEPGVGGGRGWRWDHKTVFSILAWLTFAGLLGGRAALGWRGRRTAQALYTGSVFLVLAYVGSRFVSEVILGRTP